MSMPDLDGFEEVRKIDHSTPNIPAVRWSAKGDDPGSIGILKQAHEELGEPPAVICHWKDTRLALVPALKDDHNAYTAQSGHFSCGWLPDKLGFKPDDGWYEAEIEDGILFVDFDQDPFHRI